MRKKDDPCTYTVVARVISMLPLCPTGNKVVMKSCRTNMTPVLFFVNNVIKESPQGAYQDNGAANGGT